MKSLVDQLQSSSETHEIKNYHDKQRGVFNRRPDDRYRDQNYAVQKGAASAPNSSIIQFFGKDETADGVSGPSIVILAHELVHSHDIDTGNLKLFQQTRAGVKKSEIHAVTIENFLLDFLMIQVLNLHFN